VVPARRRRLLGGADLRHVLDDAAEDLRQRVVVRVRHAALGALVGGDAREDVERELRAMAELAAGELAALQAADALYLEAFPPEERRDRIDARLGDPRFRLDVILLRGAFAGFITHWGLGAFVYGEHVATLPALRGGGAGRAALLQVIRSSPLFVGEAECADRGPMAARRLAYYARLGLHANDFPYMQPSYGVGKPEVPMRLLSAPRLLDAAECAQAADLIARVVYRGA
jgi:hypothetical protein